MAERYPVVTVTGPGQSEFTKRIEGFRRSVPEAGKGYVVYAGDLAPQNERFEAVPFPGTSALFG